MLSTNAYCSRNCDGFSTKFFILFSSFLSLSCLIMTSVYLFKLHKSIISIDFNWINKNICYLIFFYCFCCCFFFSYSNDMNIINNHSIIFFHVDLFKTFKISILNKSEREKFLWQLEIESSDFFFLNYLNKIKINSSQWVIWIASCHPATNNAWPNTRRFHRREPYWKLSQERHLRRTIKSTAACLVSSELKTCPPSTFELTVQ